MQIGILIAGSPPEALANHFPDYGRMALTLLQSVDPDVRARFYDVRDMEFPADLAENDAYLITGSKHSAYENLTWIKQLEALIVELEERRIPLVGICFGHQLIAQALGGEVRKAEQGWGVGIHRAAISNRPAWIDTDGEFDLVVSHQDQVQRLPRDAHLIAGSDFCPVAMFHKGNHVFAMQAHPEFSREFSSGLMDVREDLIGADVVASGRASLDRAPDSLKVAKWIMSFLDQAVAARSDEDRA